jgi:2-dehydro-3-deoxyphosphooctonate aldolase (KDO 8-P synthase)
MCSTAYERVKTWASSDRLFAILGPCQIESRDQALYAATFLKSLSESFSFDFVFKSSFDKANRTSHRSSRGVGREEGLAILETVRREINVPVLTDIHSESDAEAAGSVVDVLQIPAFLCRQTDLLVAAGKSGKAVNVKKGQFLAAQDMKYAAEKIASGQELRDSESPSPPLFFCERGTCFGYRDLIVDMRNFPIMSSLGYPVLFDATHSVQAMGGEGGSSGGSREFVRPLVRGALAVGVDGIFLECHPDPHRAPSDGKSMIPFEEMPSLFSMITSLFRSLRENP